MQVGAMARVALALLVACVAIDVVGGRTTQGEFQLSGGDDDIGPEAQLTKFTFAKGGHGTIIGTFWVNDKTAVATLKRYDVWLIRDDAWDRYNAALTCVAKSELASVQFKLAQQIVHEGKINGEEAIRTAKYAMDFHHRFELKGQRRLYFKYDINNERGSAPVGYYVVIANCDLEQYAPGALGPQPLTEWQVLALNAPLEHLSADEFGLPAVTLATFLLMLAYVGYCFYLVSSRAGSFKPHLAVKLVMGAYLLQTAALLCELLHLSSYSGDGRGSPFLDHLSEFFEAGATWIVMFELICIGCGWTLVDFGETLGGVGGSSGRGGATRNAFEMLRNPKKIFSGAGGTGQTVVNLVAVSIIFLATASALLIVFGKKDDNDFAAFHDHETTAGMLSALLRLLMGAFFFFAIRASKKAVKGQGKVVDFLSSLSVWGTAWFVAFPALLVVTELFPHYYHHFLVSGGVIVLQCAALLGLSRLFLLGTSEYSKLTELAESTQFSNSLGEMAAQGVSQIGQAVPAMASMPAMIAPKRNKD